MATAPGQCGQNEDIGNDWFFIISSFLLTTATPPHHMGTDRYLGVIFTSVAQEAAAKF